MLDRHLISLRNLMRVIHDGVRHVCQSRQPWQAYRGSHFIDWPHDWLRESISKSMSKFMSESMRPFEPEIPQPHPAAPEIPRRPGVPDIAPPMDESRLL
jgi:hypothetical protein